MSSYIAYANQHLIKLYQELSTKYPEQLERFKEYNNYNNYKWAFDKGEKIKVPLPFQPAIICSKYTKYGTSQYGLTFEFQLSPGRTMGISFTLDLYPECCALHQMNNFSHNQAVLINPVFAYDFIEGCVMIYQEVVNRIARIMVNFVETTRQDKYSTDDVVPPDPKAIINYPLFYTWANKYQTQENLFVNHNTARIIHNTVVNYQNGVKKS